MKISQKALHAASNLTLVVTVVLFVIAVFEKGFTHDLLLEAAVFLVSIKLVLATQAIKDKLDRLERKM
jgi:hypothetical protein